MLSQEKIDNLIYICLTALTKLKTKYGLDIIDLTIKAIQDNISLYKRTHNSYLSESLFIGLPVVYFDYTIEFPGFNWKMEYEKEKSLIIYNGEIINEYIPNSYTRCKNLGHDEFYCPTCVNRFIQNTQKLFNNVLLNPMICHDEFEKIVDGCKV